VFVASGSVRIGQASCQPGQMIVVARGTAPRVVATSEATIMLLGGEPLGARHLWWNFVSSRPERIEQAKADWRAGRIALPVGDSAEFIPLPDEPPPPPEPMS
jgi:redox-sensitive bicupin YhaK (pirin superfamily)